MCNIKGVLDSSYEELFNKITTRNRETKLNLEAKNKLESYINKLFQIYHPHKRCKP